MIIGYYGYGNAGDEHLLSKTIAYLDTYHPQNAYPVLSGPYLQIRHPKIIPIPRSQPLKIIKAIRQSAYIAVGGGGVFQDKTSFKSLVYYSSLIGLGKFFKKPIYFIAQGISPLRYSISRYLIRNVFQNSVIDVRDIESKHILIQCGLPETRISVSQDLAFFNEVLPPYTPHLLDSQTPDQTHSKHSHIGLSLRPHAQLQNILPAISPNATITYIHTQAQEDESVMTQWPSSVPTPTEHLDLLSCLQKKQAPTTPLTHIITMRYHTAIWAILNGIRCTVIPIDEKLSALANHYSLEVYDATI